MTRRQRSGMTKEASEDVWVRAPYADLKERDTVLLGYESSPPSDWRMGTCLYRDALEILVETHGFDGKPQKHIEPITRVRAFGDMQFCSEQRRLAEKATLGTAKSLRDLEDMVSEVRRAVDKLVERIATEALKASQHSNRTDKQVAHPPRAPKVKEKAQ